MTKIPNLADDDFTRAEPLISSVISVIDATYSSCVNRETCESPIEEILGGALVAMFLKSGFTAEWTDEPEKSNAEILIIPQYKINRFRADFMVKCVQPDRTIVVECDGHAFHRASSEQIERDKNRDVEIRKHGHKVIRFTGREINRDAFACAWEVIRQMNELIR